MPLQRPGRADHQNAREKLFQNTGHGQKTTVEKRPTAKIEFKYETYNAEGLKLNQAETVLVFVSTESGRPVRVPESLHDKINQYFD